MPSKVTKMLPITYAILPLKLTNQPYYLAENEFVENSTKFYPKKVDIDKYKEKLFIKQKSICFYCSLTLTNNDKNDFSLGIFSNDLEVHNKDELAKMCKSAYKVMSSFNSLVLLHKICHLEIILNIELRKA